MSTARAAATRRESSSVVGMLAAAAAAPPPRVLADGQTERVKDTVTARPLQSFNNFFYAVLGECRQQRSSSSSVES